MAERQSTDRHRFGELDAEVPPSSSAAQRPTEPAAEHAPHSRILLVDDDASVLASTRRLLTACGYEVHPACSGPDALDRIRELGFDAIVSDISMPGMDGIQLLRTVREYDLHVPVILITGQPAVATAVQALQYGALRYMMKPVSRAELEQAVAEAVRTRRMQRFKQEAAEALGGTVAQATDRAGLEALFQGAMRTLWMAYHPILSVEPQRVFGYEALLRSEQPALPHPGAVIDAAERLGQLHELGRALRDCAAVPFGAAPKDAVLFVNLHPSDLLDPMLTAPDEPLSQLAPRVVFEVTERSTLEHVTDMRSRVAKLREMGFRIAIDNLGTGYAGLNSFTLLEPEFVKLDMTLVRGVHTNQVKRKVVGSMAALAREMGIQVIAEGIETKQERDAVVELGCDLLQGFYFARAERHFAELKW